ncbi:hypothetical protein EMWEY_00004260 [Eimeria maxima]|uniref:Uncharacterized protein n=1 Tax=Eimeria maxima TaxID=5804 RepID=U6MCU3_EIMMA|nr:hypothetical protein EMWEY_00004260 [Eimeria maxima]CDJ59490.1 hypothetical protein EMWEY_00004260 [Eimeria maxima]
MDGLHSKFTLTTKVKYVIGATLLSSTFIFYIYGISAPVFRITGGGPGPFESQSGYQDFTLPRLLHLLHLAPKDCCGATSSCKVSACGRVFDYHLGTIDERATPLDFAEDSGGLLTPGLPMVPPLASTEGYGSTVPYKG